MSAGLRVLDPERYRAGASEIGSGRASGAAERDFWIPEGAVVHAEWEPGNPRRPPRVMLPTKVGERHESWCGVRIKLLLPQQFNPGAVSACPACLEAFDRGYPEEVLRRQR